MPLLRGLCASSLIQSKACPFPAVLLDPRQATIVVLALMNVAGLPAGVRRSGAVIDSRFITNAKDSNNMEPVEFRNHHSNVAASVRHTLVSLVQTMMSHWRDELHARDVLLRVKNE